MALLKSLPKKAPNFSSHLCRPVADCWWCQSGINKSKIRHRLLRSPRATWEIPQHPGGFRLSLGMLLVPSGAAEGEIKLW